MTIHIMLDLETWGTEPGCDIRSIGACVFDPLTGIVGKECTTCDGRRRPGGVNDAGDCSDCLNTGQDERGTFYIACDNPTEWMISGGVDIATRKYPLRRDPRTVKWWSDQSDEAQAAFANAVDLRDALDAFGRWLYHDVVGTDQFEEYGLTGIKLWSHGPAFDPPILAAAYRAVGLSVPWNYRTPRDTRTAFDMAGIPDDDDGSYRTWLTQFNTGTYHHALDDAIAQAKAVCAAYRTVMARQDEIHGPLELTTDMIAPTDASD